MSLLTKHLAMNAAVCVIVLSLNAKPDYQYRTCSLAPFGTGYFILLSIFLTHKKSTLLPDQMLSSPKGEEEWE